MKKELTQKQRTFAEAYVTTGNKSAAYRTAYKGNGCSDNTVRRRALEVSRHPQVAAYIAQLQAQAQDSAIVSQQEVMNELAAIAFSSLPDIADWDGENFTVKPLETLSPAQRSAIKKITQKGDYIVVEMWDKLAALEKLARMEGMYEADNQQSGPGDALDQLIAAIDGTSRGLPNVRKDAV